jgi:hypothetical protein
MYSFSAVFCFLGFAEYTEVSVSTLQLDDDPLLAAVSLLEANWISIQEIFELVNRALTRIFVGLWPKQKVEVLDLKNLAKAFDTPDDPIHVMKGLSLKRGAEGAIAFLYAHGAEVNWEKVSSSHGRPCSELKAFFEKAKRYAPGIVSMISPSTASATGTTPISLTLTRNQGPHEYYLGSRPHQLVMPMRYQGDKWICASSRCWCCFCYACFCGS